MGRGETAEAFISQHCGGDFTLKLLIKKKNKSTFLIKDSKKLSLISRRPKNAFALDFFFFFLVRLVQVYFSPAWI